MSGRDVAPILDTNAITSSRGCRVDEILLNGFHDSVSLTTARGNEPRQPQRRYKVNVGIERL